MAASSSSEEESAAGTSPEPAQQEQAASSLETMMSRLLQEFGGVREEASQRAQAHAFCDSGVDT